MRFSLLFALSLALCSTAVSAPQLIEKPGKYALSDNEEVRIEEKINARDMNVNVIRLSAKGGVSFQAVKGWKMYSNADHILWFHDGIAQLVRMELTPEGINFMDSYSTAKLWDDAPKAFVALLPKNRLRTMPKP